MLANPPYGIDWSSAHAEVSAEHDMGDQGRFGPGLPRKSDGQMLFLLHMLAKMKDVKNGGSRIAIIMNGSPLFTGDANSGESEIRRYVFENDLLEAIVAFPEQIFYNTGIATYAWIISNRKEEKRKGKVQLIDASGEEFWEPMRKSLGNKRRKMNDNHIAKVMELYHEFHHDSPTSKVYSNEFFGYRKVTVDRPLQLNLSTSQERLERLEDQRAYAKMDDDEKDTILRILEEMDNSEWLDRSVFLNELTAEAKLNGIKLNASMTKAIVNALGERDPNAEVCVNRKGEKEGYQST